MATKQIIKGVDNTVLAIGAVGVVGVGYFLYTKSKAATIIPVEQQPAALPAATTPAVKPVTQTIVTINKNLVLKKGSKGNEVRELQKLLGVSAAGIFGAQTEAALYAAKLVKQVSLNQYATLTTVNKNALPVGTRIMANQKPSIGIYRAQPLANNTYDLLSDKVSNVDFGKEIGTIRNHSVYKTRYLISRPNQGTVIYGWVNAADVIKI